MLFDRKALVLTLYLLLVEWTGLPLDGVVAHLRGLLVLGNGVVGPADAHRVGRECHGLHTYGRNHGRGRIWDGGREFIKQMEQIVIGRVRGVCVESCTCSKSYVIADESVQDRSGIKEWTME